MARIDNAITFGSGFNISAESPIDSRMRVEYESDLILAETWPKDKAPVYKGMTVTVIDTGEIWALKNPDYFQDKTSGLGWVKSGNSLVPKLKNKLLYSYDNTSLTSDYLIPENSKLYVVDNNEDFEACKGKGIIEPDIINEFLLYSDTVYMPEYGKGRSYVYGNHKPLEPDGNDSNAGIGYGYWYEDEGDSQGENKFIQNPVNSYEYNGYINPQKASYFNYDVLIGTDKGNTTGDWSGYALVNDDNAIPRNIVCSDGNTYYRNTLYDLTLSDGYAEDPYDSDESFDDDLENWCAWVNEDISENIAYVIYGKQVKISGKDYWEDEFPAGTKNVYKILDISSKESRKKYSEVVFDTVTVEKTNEASGFIAVLNILNNNSDGCNWHGSNSNLYNGLGTISIAAYIISCNTNFDPVGYEEPHIHLFGESVLVKLSNLNLNNLNEVTQVDGMHLVPGKPLLNSNNHDYADSGINYAYSIDRIVSPGGEPQPSQELLNNNILVNGNNVILKKCVYDNESSTYIWEERQVIVPDDVTYVYFIQPKKYVPNQNNLWNPISYNKSNNSWGWNNRWTTWEIYIDVEDPNIVHAYNFQEDKFESYQRPNERGTFNEFIRSNVLYDNGKLTIHFSDVIGGPNQNNVFDKTFLNKSTISTNFPLNGSEVIIDFNNDYYQLTYKGGQTGTNQILLSTLDNYIHTYEIDGKQVTINFNDLFSKNAKFMFTAYSQQNLLYKCTYYTYQDVFILRTDNNTVWKYNYLTNDYDLIINHKPSEYFTGSHLLFNEVTDKLWYSNGKEIYEVGGTTRLQNYISSLEARITALENNSD